MIKYDDVKINSGEILAPNVADEEDGGVIQDALTCYYWAISLELFWIHPDGFHTRRDGALSNVFC